MPPDQRALAKKREAEAKAGTSPPLRAALNNRLPIGDVPLRTIQAGNTLRTEAYKGEIVLKDFAPGAYVLRVEANSRSGNQFAFRELAFEVRTVAPVAPTD